MICPRLIGAAVLCFFAFFGAAASAQAPPLASSDYAAAVDAYRLRTPGAVARMAAVEMPNALPVLAWLDGDADAASRRGAAMLHTEAAIELLRQGSRDAAAAHAELAATLVLAADGPLPGARFARQWFATMEGYARAFDARDLAAHLRQRAADRMPASPALEALERGRRAELAAALAGPISRSARRRAGDGLDSDARAALTTAAQEFSTAASGASGVAEEALLHLGRVRLVLDQFDAAAAPLDRAATSEDAVTSYLALLLRGALDERQGRFDAAEARYREALERFRWGQSAPLALAHLLSRSGRVDDARRELLSHAERTGGLVVDPLWTYVVSPGDHLDASLRQLRAEVWR